MARIPKTAACSCSLQLVRGPVRLMPALKPTGQASAPRGQETKQVSSPHARNFCSQSCACWQAWQSRIPCAAACAPHPRRQARRRVAPKRPAAVHFCKDASSAGGGVASRAGVRCCCTRGHTRHDPRATEQCHRVASLLASEHALQV